MYLHELKVIQKSTIIWSLSLVGLIVLFMTVFPSIEKDAESYKKLLSSYPPQMMKTFGVSIDEFTSLLGYFSFILLYSVIGASIQGMNMGLSVLSKEVRDKTADFLLTKPVKRQQIVTAKLFASFTSILITNVIFLIGATIAVSAASSKSYDEKTFLLVTVSVFLIELMFFTLGILLSVLLPKIRSVLPISMSCVFGLYILSALGSLLGDKVIKYLTPFKYYETSYILKHSAYDPKFVWIEIIFIAAAITASYVIYSAKDVQAV